MVEAPTNRLVVAGWERLALFGLLALATALRVHKLDAPLWFDEIMTLIHFVRLPVGALAADYSSFNNHLFYSLQAKAAVTAFGEQAWALRLPALVFGVASIWALWRLARPFVTRGEALLAAGLLALSYHHIWFSQNARGYTELLFWCLAALILFLEGWRSRSWKTWAAFAATLAAAMYTHLTAGFFVAALGLAYLGLLAATARDATLDRVARWAPLAGFVGGGLLTLALCAPALPQMLTLVAGVEGDSQTSVMKEYQNPLWTLVEGVRTIGGGNPLMWVAVPAAMVLTGVGLVSLARKAPVLCAVAILHFGLTFAVLSALSMRLWPRFFFTDVAFVLLILTHGAWVLAGFGAWLAQRVSLRFATRGLVFALGAVAMLGASAALAARNYTIPKQDFPGAARLIACEGGRPQSVGALGLASEVYTDYLRPDWRRVTTVAELEALQPTEGRRWLVMIFPVRSSRSYPQVMATLAQDYVVEAKLPGTLGEGEVWVYASKAGPPLKCLRAD